MSIQTGPALVSFSGANVSTARRVRNGIATGAMWLAVAIALIPLGFIVFYVAQRGLHVFGWGFLTKSIPQQGRTKGGGMAPAIVGTLEITGAATLLAVPLGILGAVYVVEYGANRGLSAVIRFMADVMAGVPSIVMGLFIYAVYTRFFHLNGFGGTLALACLMLPIVIRSSESMLRLVPRDLREASYALGTSKSRTIVTVVLPAAAAGITSGCLLAVARAAGETAPLIFTIGIVNKPNGNLFHGSTTALSAQIFAGATSIFPFARDRAWGAALTLILLVLTLTVLARVVTTRLTTNASQ